MYAYNGEIGGFTLANNALTNGSFSIHPTNGLNLNNAFKVDISGNMTSTAGKIANWDIGANQLTSVGGKTILNSNGTITCDKLIANTSGEIGGWKINQNKLTAGDTTLNSDGTITCSKLIANTDGSIGGWKIDANGLSSGAVYIHTDGEIATYELHVSEAGLQFYGGGLYGYSNLAAALHKLNDIANQVDKISTKIGSTSGNSIEWWIGNINDQINQIYSIINT